MLRMKLDLLAPVRQAVEKYTQGFRRNDVPPLEMSGLYPLFPDEPQPFQTVAEWPEPWPLGNRQGVYLIFGMTGQHLYDGKASMGNWLGFRLGTYFVRDPLTKKCRIVPWSAWEVARPTHVATIAVPKGMGWEAPALEEYLIAELKPLLNKCGKS